MKRPQPMNRLLQGDVGSGKTIVALMAALVAMENGFQVAFMAPTEILAEQHFITIRRLLESSRFRIDAADRRDAGEEAARDPGGARRRLDPSRRRHARARARTRSAFRELGLVIIDEQHRFGVMQRATLRAKGLHPDVLVMTATPIPRTLALTTYGDLDVSVMREMPPGRHPIKTIAKPESRRDEIYDFVRQQIDAGRQAYVIYPLVEESAKVDLKAATEMADHLAQDIFPAYRVALLHGRMKQDAKDRVMGAFARGEFDILVSTTVVEVGVDVPNASVMLVEHAERFGLSQLHQLRGRVGRGAHQSYCVLLYQAPLTDQGRARLKALTETTDGFEIAERDLAAARSGRLLRHAPVRHADAPRRRSAARSPADGGRAPRSGRRARRRQSVGAARRIRPNELGAAVRAGGSWVAMRQSGTGTWQWVADSDFRFDPMPLAMRVIAGSLKGRRLEAPDWEGLRPTSDKLRETLFNVLAPRDRTGRGCSTATRGRGRSGIEALSRGAAHVTFVERDRARGAADRREPASAAASPTAMLLSARGLRAAVRGLAGERVRHHFPRSAVRCRPSSPTRSTARRRSPSTSHARSSSSTPGATRRRTRPARWFARAS